MDEETASLPTELLEVVKRNDGELVEHDLKVGYDYWTAGSWRTYARAEGCKLTPVARPQTRSSRLSFPKTCLTSRLPPLRRSGTSVSWL